MDQDRNVAENPNSKRKVSFFNDWLDVLHNGIEALEQAVRIAPAPESEKNNVWHPSVTSKRSIISEAGGIPQIIHRASSITWSLTRIVSSYRLWRTVSAIIPEEKIQPTLSKRHRKNAQLFRDLSLKHGGAFLKVGQLLSGRPDLLPTEWIEELQVLQNQTNAENMHAIHITLQDALGGKLQDFFTEFNPDPIAAASIGQVHSATLKDGRKVAIKIQRPNLQSIIQTDMSLLQAFIFALKPFFPESDLTTISKELKRAIIGELDYKKEALSMLHIEELLAPVEGVKAPRLVPELSGSTILVTEFVEGVKLTDELDRLQDIGDTETTADILGRLLDMYLRQVLHTGIFQADPHPGNLIVTPEGTLVLLDYGCTQSLPEAFRDGYLKVLSASIKNDEKTIAEQLHLLGFRTKSGKPDTLLTFNKVLLESLIKLASTLHNAEEDSAIWRNPKKVLDQANLLASKLSSDPVTSIPPEFIMLARVFTSIGGLYMHYKPKIDAQKYLAPYLLNIINNNQDH